MWCQIVLPMEAAENVKKIKQTEKDFKRKYLIFKEYMQFFDRHISISSSSTVFKKSILNKKFTPKPLKKKYMDWNTIFLSNTKAR